MTGVLRPPIIIGNSPSSGSSLLASLIGRSGAIYRREELACFDKVGWLQADAAGFQRHWPRWFGRGYARRLGCEMRVAFTNLSELPPPPKAGQDYLEYLLWFLDGLASSAGKARWVEKTPGNIFAFPILLERLPEAKFIVVHRDARATVASLMRRGFSAPLAVARWYLSTLAAHAVRPHPRVMRVAYEELVMAPVETVGRIFDFVGERRGGFFEAPERAATAIGSWRAVPSGEISKAGLWTCGDSLPEHAQIALTRIRPSSAFLSSVNFNMPPSAAELQDLFGYDCGGMHSNSSASLLRGARLRDAASYYASCARHGLMPKPLPFTFE